MPNPMLMTSSQVAARLGVSVRTVHRLATSGELAAGLKLPGPNGAFLFDEDAVEQFAQQRDAQGVPVAS